MNRYDRYKDSAIPWLGEVPEHWIIMPIKFSLAMPITDGPHETPEILSDGIPFISAEAVKNDKLDFNKKRGYISEEDNARFSRKYSPQKGDIYMVKSGATTGNVAKVETNEVFNIWSPLAVMRPNKNKISTDFLFYAIKSDYFNTSVQLKWNMGTQQNIGMGILSNIRVVVPPTDEQTAIAHYLDTKLGEIDTLIDKQQTLLEKLAEQRTAVITHAVTKGLNPAAQMKNSGVEWLGDVPAHWDIERLKFIASVNKGKMPKELISENFDDFPTYLNMDYLRNGIATHFVVDRTVPVIDENEILLLWDGANAGEFIKSKKGVISSTIALIKFQDRIYKNFAWYACLVIERILRSSTIGMGIPHVNGEELKNSAIVLPPPEEQTAIAEYLDQETAKIDRLCETVNQTIGRLKEYRTALITQAVTGKIKVTDE